MGKDLKIIHLESQALSSSVEEDMVQMVEAADLFIKIPLRSPPFHAASLYKAAKL